IDQLAAIEQDRAPGLQREHPRANLAHRRNRARTDGRNVEAQILPRLGNLDNHHAAVAELAAAANARIGAFHGFDGERHAAAKGADHLAELADPHPGYGIDHAVDRLVGLTAMRDGDHAESFAFRRLREDQREAPVAGDEADGFGHGRLQATGYEEKTP